MCVQPVAWPEPDPQVVAAIAAKYRGKRPPPLAVLIRDRLGEWLGDEDFAQVLGIRGRPGWSPSRLALVTVLQRAENLTDRLAAESARTRIDWQYLLGLPFDDPGFDHTVLAGFRGRVADGGLEQVVLDALLGRLAGAGLVKAGGKQRTDSTDVTAAVAALSRLELAGESVRAALEALAAAHPAWLEQRVCVAGFARRYGAPMTSWRPPLSQSRRDELAIAYVPEQGHGEDGDDRQQDGADGGDGVQPAGEGVAGGGRQCRAGLAGPVAGGGGEVVAGGLRPRPCRRSEEICHAVMSACSGGRP